MTYPYAIGILNSSMTGLLIGLALGIAGAVPLILIASRRTERRVRQLEARRRGTERLAELGKLTGGLAHEIKNPLSSVGLNIQLLEEDLHDLAQQLPEDSPLGDRVGRIQRRFQSLSREKQRLAEILEDFLRFAGRIRLDRTPTDVDAMVDEMADFFTPQAEAGKVRLRTQHGSGKARPTIDANLIKQALLNLLINAVQAMTGARDSGKPHGGCDELIIRTERRGDQMLIHVTDTGPGIDTGNGAGPTSSDNGAEADKIFQPYVTTKKDGSGLGLPTSRRIVEEHSGTLTYHSEPGQGTDFVIAVPIEEATADTD